MTGYRLHVHALSHWCISAEKMLALKRVPYTKVHAPYNDHTELLRISGQDYIPYLETGDGMDDRGRPDAVPHGHGGKGATWDQIPELLEARHPNPTLYPGGTRARSRLVEDWAHQVVEEAVWKYVCSDAPKVVPEANGERWTFVEMQERKRGSLDLMAKRKPEFWPEVQRLVGLAEDVLGDKPFLFGDQPSLADLALYGSLAPLWVTGNALPAEAKKMQAWKARIDVL